MKKKAQNGYIATPDWYQQFTNLYGNVNPDANQLQNVQITAQGNPNQRYLDIGQPQQLSIDNQVQAQPRSLSQQPYQGSYDTLGTNVDDDPFKKQRNLGKIQSGIAAGAKGIGDIFDTLGDIKRGIIKGGASILNALIPDTHNKRPEVPIMAYNPDPYGNQQYNNIYENGGYLKAKDGQTITVKDKNDPRYKAYQDSLAANKKSQDIINKMRTYSPNSHDWVRIGPHSAFAKPLMSEEEAANANEEAYRRTGKDNYIESFNKSGRYKDWPSNQYIGYRVPGEYNFDSKGKMYPAYDYYSPPVNTVLLENQPPTPSLPKSPPIKKLPSVGIQNNIDKPQGQMLQWDSVMPSGPFPLYGNDNHLIGTYDQNLQGQTYFYPNANYSPENQGELRGLPSNYIIPSTISTIPTNIRRMAEGGTIDIPKKNRGLFTKKANEHDMSVQEYANYVLSHKEDFPTRTERQAQFAKNFSGKKAKDGQTLTVYDRNDPRYKAYQDSLGAYNYSQKLIKKENDWEPVGKNKVGEKTAPLSQFNYDFASDALYKNMKPGLYYGHTGPGFGGIQSTALAPYYPAPSQKVSLATFDRIPTVSIGQSNLNIQVPHQIAWDNVRREGKFPLYGNDNALIGMYDTNTDGQTYFFPNQNYSPDNQGEAIGLPSNSITVPEGSTEIKNIRRMKDGGELTKSKAAKMLHEGDFDSDRQRRYFGYIAGGGTPKAASGAVVTDYGYGDIPNLTSAQEATLNQFTPYTPSYTEPPQNSMSDFGYYSPNPDGTFSINIDRHLMDRSAPSGYIGDTYSYGTNRAFGYEGLYGNKDYQPQMFMDTGYNRYFENGGTLEQGQVLNLTKAQRKYYESLGYEFE